MPKRYLTSPRVVNIQPLLFLVMHLSLVVYLPYRSLRNGMEYAVKEDQ